MTEPIQLVYLFEISIKLACDWEASVETPEQQIPEVDVSKLSEGSVEEILDETFSRLEKPCLYYTPGWFTFEICHRKQIKQYRVEKEIAENNPKGWRERITQEFFLGQR